MKRYIGIVALSMMLAACTTTKENQVVTQREYITYPVPYNLRDCPVMKQYPAPDKLTDGQVSTLIITLDKNNRKCKNSVDAIIRYHEKINEEVKNKQGS